MIPATLALSLALPFSSAPPPQEVDEELAAAVRRAIETNLASDRIPGAAVVVVRDGAIVLAEGFGLADVAAERPVDPETTLWRIGSVTKALTGLAVLILEDRGRLALSDPIDKHVPGLVRPVAHLSQPVRVGHLVAHTGGFDQIGSSRNFSVASERPGLRAFLARDLHRIRPAGEVRCYDTYGISLAGEIVASVVKKPYPDAMAALLFEPLGMTRSWVEAPESARGALATGYGLVGGELVPQDYEYYASLPASSIDATAVDIGRLLVALLGDGSNDAGRAMSANAVYLLHGDDEPTTTGRGFPGYVYGFWESFGGSTRVLHHGGTMRGYSCELTLVPRWGLGVFVAANRDSETGPAVGLHEAVTSAVIDLHSFDEGTLELAPAADEEPLATRAVDALYTQNLWCHTRPLGMGWSMGETVRVRASGKDAIELWGERWQRCAPDEFQRPGHRGRVRFERNAAGLPVRFVLSWTPGAVYERLDASLVEEVLGPQTDDSPPSPLVAVVHRANENWAEAANAYAGLGATYDEGSVPRALSDYFAGLAFARQGLPGDAEPHLLGARGAFLALIESGSTRGGVFRDLSLRSILELVIAHAQAGDADSAFRWMEYSVREAGVPADAVREEVASNPWLESLRDDERLRRLGD